MIEEKDIILAFSTNDESKIYKIFSSKEINIKQKFLQIPLLAVASLVGANSKVAKILHDKGASYKDSQVGGLSLLELSFLAGNRDFVEYAFNQGDDFLATKHDGSTILHLVSLDNVVFPLVKSLSNIINNEFSYDNQFYKISNIIKEFANHYSFKKIINKVNNEGQTPLLKAAISCNSELLGTLVEVGGELNALDANGDNILLIAAGNRNIDAINFALKKGININSVNYEVFDALSQSLWNDGVVKDEKDALIKRALEAIKNKVNSQNEENKAEEYCKWSTSHLLGIKPLSNFDNIEKIAKLLLENGINPNNFAFKFSNLERSAALGLADTVHEFIERKVDVNLSSECKTNSLATAVVWNKDEVVKKLLKAGANHEFVVDQDSGDMLLHIMAQQNNPKMLKVFVENEHVDLSGRNKNGLTPIAKAVISKQIESLKILLDAGANIRDISDNAKNLPIHYAAALNFPEAIELLYNNDKKREIDLKDKTNLLELKNVDLHTPLHLSILSGRVEAMNKLLALGAAPNSLYNDHKTILHAAATRDNPEIAQILLKSANLPIDITDQYQNTPLHIAAIYGNIKMAEYLKNMGANLNAVNFEGANIVHFAAQNGHEKIIEFAHNNQVSLDAKNKGGSTPLMFAVVGAQLGISQKLISLKVDINARDADGDSVLWVAIQDGIEMIDSGSSALAEQLLEVHFNIVKLLVDNGANIKEVHKDGSNLLHLAAKKVDLDIFKILHMAGADCYATTNDGLSPKDIAKVSNNDLVINYIEEVCDVAVSGRLMNANDEM